MTQIVPVKIIREAVKFFQGIEIILIGTAVIGSAIRPMPDCHLACILPFCLRRLGPPFVACGYFVQYKIRHREISNSVPAFCVETLFCPAAFFKPGYVYRPSRLRSNMEHLFIIIHIPITQSDQFADSASGCTGDKEREVQTRVFVFCYQKHLACLL